MKKRFFLSFLLAGFIINFCDFSLLSSHSLQFIPADILVLRRIRNLAGNLIVDDVFEITESYGIVWERQRALSLIELAKRFNWNKQDVKALFELSSKESMPLANILLKMIGIYKIRRPVDVLANTPETNSLPSGIGGIYPINDWDIIFDAMSKLDINNLVEFKVGFVMDERGGSQWKVSVPKKMTEAEQELVARYIATRMYNHMIIYGGESILVTEGPLFNRVNRFFEPLRGVDITVEFTDGSIREENFKSDPGAIQGSFLDFLDTLADEKLQSVRQVRVKALDGNNFVELLRQAVRNDKKYEHIRRIERDNSFALVMDEFFRSYYGKVVKIIPQKDVQITRQKMGEYPMRVDKNNKGVYIGIDAGGTQLKAVMIKDGQIVARRVMNSWRFDYQNMVNKAIQDGMNETQAYERLRFDLDTIRKKYFLQVIELLARDADIDLRNNKDIVSVGSGWPGQVRNGKIVAKSGAALAIKQPLNEFSNFADLLRQWINDKWGIEPEINIEHDNRIYGLGGEKIVLTPESASYTTSEADEIKFNKAYIIFGTDASRSDTNSKGRLLANIGQFGQLVINMASPVNEFSHIWGVAGAMYLTSGTAIVEISRLFHMPNVREAKDVAMAAAAGDSVAKRVLEIAGYNLAMSMPEQILINPAEVFYFAGGPMLGISGDIMINFALKVIHEGLPERGIRPLKEKYPILNDVKLVLLRNLGNLNFEGLGLLVEKNGLAKLGLSNEHDVREFLNLYIGAIGAGLMNKDGDYPRN